MTSTIFDPEPQPSYQGEVVGVAFGRETKDGEWISDGTYVTVKLDTNPRIGPGRCTLTLTNTPRRQR